MKKVSLLSMTAAFAVGSVAAAQGNAFLGFDGIIGNYNDGVSDYTIIEMFAVYDAGSGTITGLNTFEMDVFTSDGLGFNQSDTAFGTGGSFNPASTVDIPGFANSLIDSYVAMGAGAVALDPGFGDGSGTTVPSGAGWYNGNPAVPATASPFTGEVDGLNGVGIRLGQFVVDSQRVVGDWTFTFSGQMGSSDSSGEVFFGSDSFVYAVPAPGALALLGLGGLVARRRRA